MPKERILIVDDEPLILDIAEKILVSGDFETITAKSGEEAVEIIGARDIDLLLTDIKMPGLSGMELLKIFKEKRPDAAAVVITGHGTIDTAVEAMGIGANGFIIKPFTKGDLLNTVNIAFEKMRIVRENVRLKSLIPLFEVSRRLMEKVDTRNLLNYVVDVAIRETGADSVSIMLKRADGSLVVEAQEGLEESFERGYAARAGEGFAGRVARTGLPLLLREDNACTEDVAEMESSNISSAIVLPMKVEDEILGAMSLTKLKRNLPLFAEGDLDFMGVLASQAAVALKNAMLVEDLKELFLSSIRSLSRAIDTKSPWTAGHSERVTAYALILGREMGFSDKELDDLELAGLLHDVGKIGTCETILDKPGKLTDEEFEMVRKHPASGAELLEPIRQLRGILPAVRHHHENFDGSGYPDRLKGEQIPLMARILAVSDTFDAMKADRPYRRGRSMDFIVEEFRRCSGTQFDPEVVAAFMKRFGKKKKAAELQAASGKSGET